MARFDFANNKCLIRPNATQLKVLRRWAEARRYAWNKSVERFSDAQFAAVGWLKAVPSNIVRFARDDHKRYGGGFRSRFRDNDNFRLSSRDAVLERGGWLNIPGLGRLRLRGFRELKGRVVAYQVREEYGRWFVTIARKIELPRPVRPKPGRVVGIDLGIADLATLSTGQKVENPFYFRQVAPQVAHLVERIKRGQPGSRRNNRIRNRLGRILVAVRNRRNDYLHRFSAAVVKRYQGLGLETLDARQISETCRSNRDAQIGLLAFFLKYKAAQRGVAVHCVSRWYPSSKTCSKCGHINSLLQLSDREWECPGCGVHHDRDVNAAINLRQQAIQALC